MTRINKLARRSLAAAAVASALALSSGAAHADGIPRSSADGSDVMGAVVMQPARAIRALAFGIFYVATLPVTQPAGNEPEYYDKYVKKPINALADPNAR